jgi:hypothetical protein
MGFVGLEDLACDFAEDYAKEGLLEGRDDTG